MRSVDEPDGPDPALRADALLHVGQLAAGVAHELRNPLSVIETSVYLLQEQLGDDPRAARQLRRISEQLAVAGAIVNDLLDTVRGRHAPPSPTASFDLARVVREAVAWVPRPPRLTIALRLPEDPLTVPGDARRIRQVVINLVANAVQILAGHDDSPGIAVTLDADADAARVAVRDHGPGIADELLPRLFEPFVTTRPQGTGLGLALSRRIARDHRGDLVAESLPPAEGGGARFTLTLPLAPPKAP
jgi:signal transduction histidine kinase